MGFNAIAGFTDLACGTCHCGGTTHMKDNCENYHGAFFAALHAKQQEGREPAPSVFEDNGDYETQCNTAMLHDPTKGFETEADFDEAYLQAQEERI